MGRRVVLALLLAATELACTGQTVGATPDAAPTTVDSEGAPDATSGAPGTLPDGGPICPGPIANNMGISSLFDLPVDVVCGSSNGYQNRGTESKSCAGTIRVGISDGVDCSDWWLFDAKTGDLEAVGSPCAGSDGLGCEGARPGFVYPSQCENNNGWGAAGWTELCTDASAVQAPDAGDACAPSSCPVCPSETSSYFSVVDGCVVWQCCL
jgi:hypothetical protein